MRTLPLLIAPLLATLTLPFAVLAADRDPLAHLHPAGKPVDCVQTRFYGDTDFVGASTIVFSDGLGRAYANALGDNCAILRKDAAIATVTPQDELCRGDIVTVFDPVSHITYGSCALGSFAPYAR